MADTDVVIFREGDPALQLLVVKSGAVEIRIRDRLIDTLGERSIFGENGTSRWSPAERDIGSTNRYGTYSAWQQGIRSVGCLSTEVRTQCVARAGEARARGDQ
jgi:hypothetical protein